MKRNENPFDIVGRLFTENNVDVNKNEYMVNRILSFQPATILLSIGINKFVSRLPSWASKQLFNLGVQKQKRSPYLKYLKRGKKQNPKLLKKICWAFCCNEYHANQIISIVRKMNKLPEEYFGLKPGE
jgi:hypothetical protein